MSQRSGSPVTFLDQEACDMILLALRRKDGTLPNFESDPGTPPPELEAAVACDRGKQTSPSPTHDQQVQAIPPQRVAEGSTQTLPIWTRDKCPRSHTS